MTKDIERTRTAPSVLAIVATAFVLSLTFLSAGCKQQKTVVPALVGPSELGLSLILQAIPDVLTLDGLSSALISIEARGANAQPMGNVPVRLEILFNGEFFDFGALSTHSVVTDSNGRADVTYTAPFGSSESVDSFVLVTIRATPIGSNFANAVARSVEIRLVPQGAIIPRNQTPTAAFAVSAPTEEGTPITFDASTSTDEDGNIVSYAWTFGDGTSATGVTASKTYSRAGTYTVILTVTDDRGGTDTISSSVVVATTAAPTADIKFSPGAPGIRETVFFTGEGSRAVTGRQIVSYDWQFGDGGSDTGVRAQYEAIGTYLISLTVTDDIGKKGTTTAIVEVAEKAGGLFGSFTFSPTNPGIDQSVFFDASASTSPDGIKTYTWSFGNGTPAETNFGPTTSHTYSTKGEYVVRLTIVDRTG